MPCKEARERIKEWGESVVRGKEPIGSSGDAEEAFNHIRECSRCSDLWRKFNNIIADLERSVQPPKEFEEDLPFAW